MTAQEFLNTTFHSKYILSGDIDKLCPLWEKLDEDGWDIAWRLHQEGWEFDKILQMIDTAMRYVNLADYNIIEGDVK